VPLFHLPDTPSSEEWTLYRFPLILGLPRTPRTFIFVSPFHLNNPHKRECIELFSYSPSEKEPKLVCDQTGYFLQHPRTQEGVARTRELKKQH